MILALDFTERLFTAQEAARAAGEIHLQGRTAQLTVSRKSHLADLVTQVDQEAEEAIRRVIDRRHPGELLLGEESENTFGGQMLQDDCWIVDPLDGTQNFVFGVPLSCVSVAYVRGGKVQVGVIHDPLHGETFSAVRGQGAHLNGRQLHVSTRALLDAPSLLGTGFPRGIKANSPSLKPFLQIIERGLPIRRLSCAALSLAYVACGRMDGYWDEKLAAWDTAAGILLIAESGGQVTNMRGDPYVLGGTLLASNTLIHEELLTLTRLAVTPD
ncbi:inositol monophosphatase family protein [Deinococcus oregonensis]|uniref:Inositol-1-monophosphatase n=1 Tax=Deinococcus oregonensis TaxID=1805970 RepID=A0ABV6AVR7_9DEIO